MLESARQHAGMGGGFNAHELQQLVLIIADGRFHEKASLQRAVAVSPVHFALQCAFVGIVGNRRPRQHCWGYSAYNKLVCLNSLTTCAATTLSGTVQEASAQKGVLLAFIIVDNPASSLLDMQTVGFEKGKPVFSRYIDSFPFPYYIVLQDIAALPRTLADLLTQWIALSSV
jgi:hypothetical protein